MSLKRWHFLIPLVYKFLMFLKTKMPQNQPKEVRYTRELQNLCDLIELNISCYVIATNIFSINLEKELLKNIDQALDSSLILTYLGDPKRYYLGICKYYLV